MFFFPRKIRYLVFSQATQYVWQKSWIIYISTFLFIIRKLFLRIIKNECGNEIWFNYLFFISLAYHFLLMKNNWTVKCSYSQRKQLPCIWHYEGSSWETGDFWWELLWSWGLSQCRVLLLWLGCWGAVCKACIYLPCQSDEGKYQRYLLFKYVVICNSLWLEHLNILFNILSTI